MASYIAVIQWPDFLCLVCVYRYEENLKSIPLHLALSWRIGLVLLMIDLLQCTSMVVDWSALKEMLSAGRGDRSASQVGRAAVGQGLGCPV